uniref:Uncharacterized protein n=1 Tax=Anguilla anguilla TaxID=7936 RepID=A0A0E9WWY4_ANGAN
MHMLSNSQRETECRSHNLREFSGFLKSTSVVPNPGSEVPPLSTNCSAIPVKYC